MSEHNPIGYRYMRAGPFGQGAFANVPCHEFTRHVEGLPHAAPFYLFGQYWQCVYCGTLVSVHQRAEAATHACDGTTRCAICNAPVTLCTGTPCSWAGYICNACREAHKQVLTVQSPVQAQVGQKAS